MGRCTLKGTEPSPPCSCTPQLRWPLNRQHGHSSPCRGGVHSLADVLHDRQLHQPHQARKCRGHVAAADKRRGTHSWKRRSMVRNTREGMHQECSCHQWNKEMKGHGCRQGGTAES
eukprot:269300-Pelagomonas_calceolata.AAC.12